MRLLTRSVWTLLLLSLTLFAAAGDLGFAGGTCRPRTGGGFDLELPCGRLSVDPTWVTPGWGFQTVSDARQTAVLEDGKLLLSFTAVAPAGFKTQDDLPMLVIVNGDGKGYPSGLFRLAYSGVASLEMPCAWGCGNYFESDALRLRFELDAERVMSFWNDPKTLAWNIRVQTKGEPRPDGSVSYSASLKIAEADVKIPRPADVVAQKRVQYRRILTPPQEVGLDVGKWLALCADPNTTNREFGRLEDLLDTRADLYSLSDALRHRGVADPHASGLVEKAYGALGDMDLETARRIVSEIKAVVGNGREKTPLVGVSPFSWIKSFTQWGYVRHPDGHGCFEPVPWNLQWQDGFRCNVDQDARVAVANSAANQDFYETRYLEPMTDVAFERSWTSTKWLFKSGKSVTFSVLSPVVDVEGVEEIRIGGFSVPPDRVEMIDTCGRIICVRLTEAAQYVPEVIPSALIDQSKPPPGALPPSVGKTPIDPKNVGRPWIRAFSPRDRGLILLPGARPVSVAWKDGVLSVAFARRSYVGVMRPPANLYPGEYPEVAEFFARMQALNPIACRESVGEGKCVWSYDFSKRETDWALDTTPIAPVPPLVGFAGLTCKGEKTFKYPTKWGPMRYVEGKSATCDLPAQLPRESLTFRGVNCSIWEPVGSDLAILTNGVVGVRLLTLKDKTVEESCRRFAEVLSVYRKHGVKAILDAHNSVYGVWWNDGIGPCDEFVKMWDAFSAVGAKFKDVVVGYDLNNEPGTSGGSEELWRKVCARAAKAILANHPEAKIYYPALAGGNPNGLANLRPLDIDPRRQVMTYHFYSPHSFTHQKCSTLDIGGDTCVFYPSWGYPNDWKAGHHFGGTTVDWFDKWSLGVMMLPAFEHYAQYRIPQYVGEFGVIGYANGHSPRSAFLWTRDAAELFEHVGANWHLWNGGFGLGNKFVKEWFFHIMHANEKLRNSQTHAKRKGKRK